MSNILIFKVQPQKENGTFNVTLMSLWTLFYKYHNPYRV